MEFCLGHLAGGNESWKIGRADGLAEQLVALHYAGLALVHKRKAQRLVAPTVHRPPARHPFRDANSLELAPA